ncbi:MAG TPA: lysozyme inhibitor LprI family protein [Chloroflexota bacterium]|nr:lysozyme inhibitor LprI family protein [Chloroflexota bacterium]
MAGLLAGTLLIVPPTLADPVGECQAATTTQVETGQCLTDTLGAAEQVLGSALERAQKKADELDQVTGRVVARPALDKAQAEWETYRTTNCAVRAAFAGGASGSGQFVTSCEIMMTRARTDELYALAG